MTLALLIAVGLFAFGLLLVFFLAGCSALNASDANRGKARGDHGVDWGAPTKPHQRTSADARE